MTIAYCVDWADEFGNVEVVGYGGNLNAAKAKARRLSRKPNILMAYVIKSIDGTQVGQWVFAGGQSCGYEE